MTERIDNYPGSVDVLGGAELADKLRAHAERFGVEILSARTVTEVHSEADYKMVATESGARVLLTGRIAGPRHAVPAVQRLR